MEQNTNSKNSIGLLMQNEYGKLVAFLYKTLFKMQWKGKHNCNSNKGQSPCEEF